MRLQGIWTRAFSFFFFNTDLRPLISKDFFGVLVVVVVLRQPLV